MTNSGRPERASARRVHGGGAGLIRFLAGGGLALALQVGAPAASAEAQAPAGRGPAPSWVRARLDGRLDPGSRVAVERLIDSAHAAGLPAEPLVDKALEAASKGAQREATLRALRALAADLAVARRSLGTASLADELNAGAAALRGGVDDAALRRLRQERPGQPLVVALGVLSDLIARGVPADAASRTVLALTEAGAADEQLVAFRREVERDIGIGAPPAAAAMLRASSARLNVIAGSGGGTGGVRAAPPARPKP